MLLSIDRVLQLLGEGKTTQKIAEMAGCTEADVIEIIEEARRILARSGKNLSRKKIILKKNLPGPEDDSTSEEVKKLFQGAELSAVPVESSLVMYVDGVSLGNPGPSGIGIVILDKDDRQVGKVSCPIGTATSAQSEYQAVIRALSIAAYFNTRTLRIRTDGDLLVRQLAGEVAITHSRLQKMREEIESLQKGIPSVKIEWVSRPHNDKADHLARQAAANPRVRHD